MVVGLVARVRNASSRTFYIVQAGDPFYTPKIGGELTGDDPFEVPPGFDEQAEGLVVPWAATSRCGLVIGEASSPDTVRCVVGPTDLDGGTNDWLRLHESAWEPLAQGRWLALGPRHLLGTIGGVVELTLTFRDSRSCFNGKNSISDQLSQGGTSEKSMPAQLIAECSHFEQEAACAPANTVFLNVFDLIPGASIPNAVLCNTMVKTFGAFHAAVEVYGEEWSFYRQQNPDECGICRSRKPREHPVHVYRQSVNLGTTPLKDWEVFNIIRRDVLPLWPSSRYDLIHCNCIHFCDEFLQRLGANPAPSWVKGLHETGAAILRPLSMIMTAQLSLGIAPDCAESDVALDDPAVDDARPDDANSRSSSAIVATTTDDPESNGFVSNFAKLGKRLSESFSMDRLAANNAEMVAASGNDSADAPPRRGAEQHAADEGTAEMTADNFSEPNHLANLMRSWSLSWPGNLQVPGNDEKNNSADSEQDHETPCAASAWSNAYSLGAKSLETNDAGSDCSDTAGNDSSASAIDDRAGHGDDASRSSTISWPWASGSWTLGGTFRNGLENAWGTGSWTGSSQEDASGASAESSTLEVGTVQPYRPPQNAKQPHIEDSESWSTLPRPRFLPELQTSPRCQAEHRSGSTAVADRSDSFVSVEDEVVD